MARFPSRDHFAAYDGTAPIEVSSGNRKIYRLSLRGNRRVNHAIHMAAITQIRHTHSDGRAYYDKKVAECKTHKEALRCLKRRISDAIYARLQADARQAAQTPATGPGGQPGNDSDSSAAGYTPNADSSDKPLPSPPHPTTRHPGQANHAIETHIKENPPRSLTPVAKRARYGRQSGRWPGLQGRTRKVILVRDKPISPRRRGPSSRNQQNLLASPEADPRKLATLGDETSGAVPYVTGLVDTLSVDQLRLLQNSHRSGLR